MNRRSFLQKSLAMALSLPLWARGMSLQASSRMPALFMAHGSPMNAIQDNTFTRTLTQIGQHLARPQAILMVSAH
jgi:4,5-DOPA dioxygenase extradiol